MTFNDGPFLYFDFFGYTWTSLANNLTPFFSCKREQLLCVCAPLTLPWPFVTLWLPPVDGGSISAWQGRAGHPWEGWETDPHSCLSSL